MPNELKLNKPWLVAVWPGMGNVAISAGYYLIAKLEMHILAEFQAHELFDVDHVEVKAGIIRTGRLPRSRFFAWTDPRGKHDIVVFLGEAQPPRGRYAFCRRLVEFAKSLGVEKVFTFAAMATQMHPDAASRIFVAATDAASLKELEDAPLEILGDGRIGGLNGVLLGAGAEAGLHGACLLGEMPHVFAQLPFPKASLAVLQAFTKIAEIQLNLGELADQAREMEQKLGELLAQMQQAIARRIPDEAEENDVEEDEDEEAVQHEPAGEEHLKAEDKERIERLFKQATQDRSCAYELKRELDRLGVYRDYEDRFLDLFKKQE
jgi:proteasome assembly chaperone (PAC2) family protein